MVANARHARGIQHRGNANDVTSSREETCYDEGTQNRGNEIYVSRQNAAAASRTHSGMAHTGYILPATEEVWNRYTARYRRALRVHYY